MNKLSVIIVLSLFSIKLAAQKHTKKPNIIFIMTDDQSAIVPNKNDKKKQSHPFGFNGDPRVYTPIIDSLAANGMVFNSAYVSSSVCAPSRYSILTGRYAGRCEGDSFIKLFPQGTMTRVSNNTELELNRENLPRLLQKAGYKTGFVGKNHVIAHQFLNAPKKGTHGFMPYGQLDDPKQPETNKAMMHNHQLWSKTIKTYGFDYANGINAANLKELYNDSLKAHHVEWKNKAALDFIDLHAEAPFFLYYSETIPHGPAPWIKTNGKYTYSFDANPKFSGEGFTNHDYSYLPTRQNILEEMERMGKAKKHAWLRWFDLAIGALVKKLKEKNIYENTLIVITSDHGNYNAGKSTLYESGIKVPLMMHWPKGITPNSTYDELVQNIDFTPTFLELAGVNVKQLDPIDGISLVKPIKGSQKPIHDYLFFEMGFARAVMTKNWKYISLRYDAKTNKKIANGETFKGYKGPNIKYPYYIKNKHLGYYASQSNPLYFEKNQLFNLKEDPLETKNIFDDNNPKVKPLKTWLSKRLKSFPNRPYAEFTKNHE